MMLTPPGIGVPDWPQPFPYALERNAPTARLVADHLHEHDDRVMWAMLFDDVERLKVRDAAHRSVHGCKFQTIPKPDPQGVLL